MTKLRSPNVAQLGDTLSCKTLTAVPIPQLWGASLGFGGAAGDQDFRLISDGAQAFYQIPVLQAGALGCPFLGALRIFLKQFPKSRLKMLEVENLGVT